MRARLIAFIIAGFLIGALAGAAVLFVTTPKGGQTVQSSGTALVGGPFSLTSTDGKTVTDRDFSGRYMLVFFGFTHCPDICPTSLFEISEVLKAMGKDADRVNAYFVSVDPERDTATAMKEYLSSFDPHLKGLTGDPEAVAKVLAEYRVYSKKVPLKDGDYTMDHTALIYLMDRDGHFVSPFNLKRTPEEAATDLKRYL
jgi:protein SCO1/2